MKKLFLATLIVVSFVSCTTNNTNQNSDSKFFKISKEINNNADDIMLCMQSYYSNIDQLIMKNQLSVEAVNDIKRSTSMEMKKLLKISFKLSTKLCDADLPVKQYDVLEPLLIRIQTSGAAFLTVDDLRHKFW